MQTKECFSQKPPISVGRALLHGRQQQQRGQGPGGSAGPMPTGQELLRLHSPAGKGIIEPQ